MSDQKRRRTKSQPPEAADTPSTPKTRPQRSLAYVAIAIVVAIVAAAVLLIDPESFNETKTTTENVKFPSPPLENLPRDSARTLTLAYNTAIQTPEDGGAWGKLGQTYYAHELIPQSLICLQQAENLDPEDPRWPYLFGMITAESNTALGLSAIERAVELDPENVEFRTRLAEFLFTLERPQDSRTQFERVRAAEPQNPRVLLGLARLAFTEQNWQACRDLAEQALQMAPMRPDIRELLSQTCFRLGDKQAAKLHADELAKLHGASAIWTDKYLTAVMAMRTDPDSLLEQAEQLGAAGRVNEQLQLLDRLVQVSPDNPDAFIRFARALLRAGNLPAAAQVVARGCQLHSDNVELLLMQAVTLLQMGETDQSIQKLQGVLKRKPDYAEAFFILGNAHAQQQDDDQAIEAFRNVLRYEPLFAPAHAALAELLKKQGKTIEAAKHQQQAQQ